MAKISFIDLLLVPIKEPWRSYGFELGEYIFSVDSLFTTLFKPT